MIAKKRCFNQEITTKVFNVKGIQRVSIWQLVYSESKLATEFLSEFDKMFQILNKNLLNALVTQ